MDGLEWLVFQIIVWTLSLLVVFFILFSIKFRRSETILKIFGFLADRPWDKIHLYSISCPNWLDVIQNLDIANPSDIMSN